MTRIGFSGTRHGMRPLQKQRFHELLRLYQLGNKHGEFHHGDCVGADAQAHDIAYWMRFDIYIHPPTNGKLRAFKQGARQVHEPQEYLERNRNIVADTEHLIAAPASKTPSVGSGTWYTIDYARQLKRPTTIIFPDGSIKEPRYD